MPLIPLIAAVVTGVSSLKAGKDAKAANKKAAEASMAEAAHRKQVAEYNASILKDQSKRLREEMVARLNEAAGINIDRLKEDLSINAGRLNEAYTINTGRIGESRDTDVTRTIGDATTQINRLQEDSLMASARVQEKADTTVRRLQRDAIQEVAIGGEEENKIRRIASEGISSTRAFYGARNIVIDSGTPAALQVDAARMGEVDALRMRRNYRVRADAMLEQAADVKRDALWSIGDINRVAAYNISDVRTDSGRLITDTIQVAGQQLDDYTRNWGYETGDINRVTGQQLSDISRTLGYDLSDNEAEADNLDSQAALIILQGDAELAAGVNRADAYKTAGSNAMTQGILGAVGAIVPQIKPEWITGTRATPAPVSTSTPSFVR